MYKKLIVKIYSKYYTTDMPLERTVLRRCVCAPSCADESDDDDGGLAEELENGMSYHHRSGIHHILMKIFGWLCNTRGTEDIHRDNLLQ